LVTGGTISSDFPTASALQSVYGGGGDAFVVKLNPAGSALVYSTLLGGSGGESGNAIAVEPSGSAYVVGYTGSDNFPTKNAYQATRRNQSDAFLTKIASDGSALLFSTFGSAQESDEPSVLLGFCRGGLPEPSTASFPTNASSSMLMGLPNDRSPAGKTRPERRRRRSIT